MSTDSTWVDQTLAAVAVLAVLLGVFVAGYGLLLIPVSTLGGVHVAATGVCLFLAGVFATEWAGEQFGLAPTIRRHLSLGFAVLALLLLGAFLVPNSASVSGPTVETETDSGSN